MQTIYLLRVKNRKRIVFDYTGYMYTEPDLVIQFFIYK